VLVEPAGDHVGAGRLSLFRELFMQTFLPYPSYAKSARVLDHKRLGKQRVECKQILRALGVTVGQNAAPSRGWVHHPAVVMWRGYEHSLCSYAIEMCVEWRRRGYQDSLLSEFRSARRDLFALWRLFKPTPSFVGNREFHASHRSNLLRKDPAYYGQFGWSEPADLPYHWPTAKEHANG
jgi:hypothetical protein